LVHHYRPEPADHWRFTADSIRLLAEGNGFRPVAIHPLGGRWSSAASILMPFLRPRPAAPFVVYWLSLRLDAWARRFALPECPMGYVVEARRAA
jgi:hypothetical protein